MHSPDGKKRGGADAASLGGPLVMQTLVRQAQLGASYRVTYSASRVRSPYRAKLNQQPVPSVALVAESGLKSANKTGEAYTGDTAGRRGDVPPSSNSAS